ncbi:GNAT family N-acetyltransferase [Ulvibacter litoralis]|uniref:Ribosomal-protein-alanine N-acetyltransferase n=1 Tax=Ulvibacter litoralis TaxID=227084 RepID=A0A1G7D3X7_9FLAO|nr:GNAT family N-acetyltransferase [Ulvibacter litoralis]GHC44952.1 ribosomal-protein-amino-adic N-acetyltransferase [Ulvibacter litoralis]SDE46229.1 ribosomal-protein-alanine N-acetyltransferase [Ulvibacter litoralis]
MYKSDSISIVPFKTEDAEQLCGMMLFNKLRFELYFPNTLAQNLSVKASEAYILKKQNEIKNNIEFTFAIKETKSDIIAGIIILKEINPALKEAELAYAIDQTFGGKGYTSKAVSVLSDYAFTTLGIETLRIIVHKSNVASAKVAQKNGYQWVKTLPNEYTPKNGTPLDMELYELEKQSV